ncbi:fungal-specific transcription factor domain-containing protein [Abortiporus biennis]|nr:fungal-specific transcription factor domain-containing protein [Abortiporus biennis]
MTDIESLQGDENEEDGTLSSKASKRKRNRMILSCVPCHQRKQQCDREQPCQRCLKRGSGEACVYEQRPQYTPPKTQPAETINERISQLEGVVQGMLGDMDPASLAGLEALLQMIQSAQTAPRNIPGSDYHTPHTSNLTQNSQIPMNTHPQSPVAVEHYVSQLPDHGIRVFLLTHYFDHSSVHWIWPVIHRPIFDISYIALHGGNHPSLDYIALLAIVLALSLQFLLPSTQDASIFRTYTPGRYELQRRMVDIARSLLLSPSFTPLPSVERVQGCVLFAIYAQNEGNLLDSYSATGTAIRTGLTLGMNRDPQTWQILRPSDVEQRRRFWWMLFILDRVHCGGLRRPWTIHEAHADVKLPINLDQAQLTDSPNLTGYPDSYPTAYLFQLQHIQWSRLYAEIWDKCFSIQLPTYRAVLTLEKQILRLEFAIPEPLNARVNRMEECPPYLQFQKQYLALSLLHIRILLLRPFLFLRAQPEDTISSHDTSMFAQHARTVCIFHAKRLLALVNLMQKQVHSHQLRWSSIPLQIFDAALSITMAVITKPSDQGGKGLEVWINLAKQILQSMRPYSIAASNAFDAVEVMCKRSRLPGRAQQIPSLAQNMDINLEDLVYTQSPPSVSQLLDEDEDNEIWKETATVYAGSLPGLEALCGPMFAESIDTFLNTCRANVSR